MLVSRILVGGLIFFVASSALAMIFKPGIFFGTPAGSIENIEWIEEFEELNSIDLIQRFEEDQKLSRKRKTGY